jgi:hypothetical protein
MAMSLNDAQLFYDGRIPPGAVDPKLPDYFTRPKARTRLVNVKEKPEAIVARMAAALAVFAGNGTATEYALKKLGFSDAEIAEYGPRAVRQMLRDNPTFTTIAEWGA